MLADAAALAERAAEFVAQSARDAVATRGSFAFAVSGGSTPWAMFALLREADVPWEHVVLHQVDERVAPAGDPARNLTQLVSALGPVAELVAIHAMPVTETDLDAAADRYAGGLPSRLDLVHLGLGADGHTASLVPGDPVIEVRDRDVALTGDYQGHRRMTLTYPAIERAAQVLWLVGGSDKAEPLRRLLARDPSVPAGRVAAPSDVVMTDQSL